MIKINKSKLRKTIYVYIVLMLILIFCSNTIYNFSLPKVAVTMPVSGKLTKELEVRGVITFSEIFEIYADSSGQIKEMLIKKGDSIDGGTIIATYKSEKPEADTAAFELALAVERIETHIVALNLNRAYIQEKIQALSIISEDDLFDNQNAVEDARNTLDKRRAELLEAQNLAGIFSGEYEYQQAIADAEKGWEGQEAELEAANTALEAALAAAQQSNIAPFDDYEYNQNILDASIALERKKTELADACAALADAKRSRSIAFDNYTYENAINTAETTYDRSLEDYEDALRMYDSAVWQYDNLIYAGADEPEIELALNNIDDLHNRVTLAKRALDDASETLNTAINDMARAENAFIASIEKSITDAEQQVKLAEYAVGDAQRFYDRALTDLDRARNTYYANLDEAGQKAIDDAKKEVEITQLLADDAERVYYETVAGRNAAADAEARAGRKNLLSAGNNLTEAQIALARAEANYVIGQKALITKTDDMKKSLEHELQKADLDIAGASLDLRSAEAALAIAAANDIDAGIVATRSGVVLSVDKNVGQFVSRGEKIATAGVDKNTFAIEVACQEQEGRFIKIGDEASIRANGASFGIKATVNDIALMGTTINISLVCETDELKGGEYVAVRFYKQTDTYETIVPNEAVIRETAGSFVWVVRSRSGALGTEYYSIRIKVLVADMDDYYTAISRGMDFFEPVVVNYNKDLTINGRVSRME